MKKKAGITIPQKAQVLKGSLLELIINFFSSIFGDIARFFRF